MGNSGKGRLGDPVQPPVLIPAQRGRKITPTCARTAMIGTIHPWRTRLVAGGRAILFAAFLVVVPVASRDSEAGEFRPILSRLGCGNKADCGPNFEGLQ